MKIKESIRFAFSPDFVLLDTAFEQGVTIGPFGADILSSVLEQGKARCPVTPLYYVALPVSAYPHMLFGNFARRAGAFITCNLSWLAHSPATRCTPC